MTPLSLVITLPAPLGSPTALPSSPSLSTPYAMHTQADKLTIADWFTCLQALLPLAYCQANRMGLLKLYVDGATPRLAAIYAKAYGCPARAPR
jgi:hypothetical protein